jgi:hypothetical protein
VEFSKKIMISECESVLAVLPVHALHGCVLFALIEFGTSENSHGLDKKTIHLVQNERLWNVGACLRAKFLSFALGKKID